MVQYTTRIIVNQRGEIQNTDCECGGGEAPHSTCKHICASLQLLTDFKELGKLQISRSCTEDSVILLQSLSLCSYLELKSQRFWE